MPRLSVFDSPLLLGFDHFERILDRVSKTSPEGYPPYNIEQIGENALRITLAVAGFSMDDLNITIDQAFQFIVSCGVVIPAQQVQKMIEGAAASESSDAHSPPIMAADEKQAAGTQ